MKQENGTNWMAFRICIVVGALALLAIGSLVAIATSNVAVWLYTIISSTIVAGSVAILSKKSIRLSLSSKITIITVILVFAILGTLPLSTLIG